MPSPPRAPLPVDEVLDDLVAALRDAGAAVLVAPPGAGKTTRVPPALLDAGVEGRILVLQPRRVAARLAARRIASERGWELGGVVGYRTRFERQTSRATRLEVITEGLLTRALQRDPFLEGVGAVVLDELHERSLHLDLALGLLREVRTAGRRDLLLLAMSATLDPAPVADFLGGCPVLTVEGRTFPVELRWDPRRAEGPIHSRCAAAVRSLHREGPTGHVLVFLPGVAEIRRTAAALGELPGADVLPLHGRLRAEEQDRALSPGRRPRVVLATNVAETSVTLDGVAAVVDSGLVRVPRFDPGLGLERLETVRVSQASADQRAGRAGRTGPGLCRRLWTEAEHRQLAAAAVPEVRRADMTGAVLELLVWGVDPRTFEWFEAPPQGALLGALRLLEELGAIDAGQTVTPLGRELAALPLPPRLGRVVLAGRELGLLRAAATATALVSERDPFREAPALAGGCDLLPRLEALEAIEGRRQPPRGLDRGALATLRRVRNQLVAAAGGRGHHRDEPLPSSRALAEALLAGFPDRVGRRRKPGSRRYRLAGGRGAVLDEDSAARDAELLLAVALSGARRGERADHRIRLATSLEPGWLQVEEEVVVAFDPDRESVVQRQRTRYRDLVLTEVPVAGAAEPGEVAAALAEAAAAAPERALSWSPAARTLLARLRCLAEWRPGLELPTFEDLRPLLADLCQGRRAFSELRRVDLRRALLDRLTWPERQALDRDAPESFRLPSGRHVRLRYEEGGPPVLAARIQQLFGVVETPRVAGSRVPVQVHLLAPNGRPAQVTQDLASFWRNTYPEVRKELRGRYPKHAWPEEPG